MNARAINVSRTMGEIRKKWKDLLSKAKKDASSQKNPPTGGGPLPNVSPYSEIVLNMYERDSPTVIGIDGGLESSVSQCTE